jgi:DNA polymerase zeta
MIYVCFQNGLLMKVKFVLFFSLMDKILLKGFLGLNPSFGLRDFVTLLDYGWTRSMGNFRLIYELDLINKTSEFARIYGIEFYHVRINFSRKKSFDFSLKLGAFTWITISC